MRMPLSLLAFLILLAELALGAEFHISPSGNDANPGSVDQPLRSLAAARNAIRKINRAMAGEIAVYLHGGEYQLDETVAFEPGDSGHGGHKVIYCAANGETPILTGGIRVTQWKLHDAEKSIYRAHVSAKLFRQLYIDGVPAIRARTPNRTSETLIRNRFLGA